MTYYNWAVFTLSAGFIWCFIMAVTGKVVYGRTNREAWTLVTGGSLCLVAVVIIRDEAGVAVGEARTGMVVGIVLGLISAFGIFHGTPPKNPPS